MHLYPSEGWLKEYTRLLDESDALDDLSSGVGLDFAGSVHLAIESCRWRRRRSVTDRKSVV